MSKVIIGAPSLTGVGADVSEFKKLKYPVLLLFANLTGLTLSFPEIKGLRLLPSGADNEGDKFTAKIDDFDALQRVATSIACIADVNKKAALVSIELVNKAKESEKLPDQKPVDLKPDQTVAGK